MSARECAHRDGTPTYLCRSMIRSSLWYLLVGTVPWSTLLAQTNTLVEQYNQLVNERNEIALEQKQLQQSINSSIQ